MNTVSFVDGIKYHRTNEDYQFMRDVSDRLCREYGLSVVKHPEGKKKNYGEWSAEKNGKPTYRQKIRDDIDRAIAASLTETEFYDALEEMGYELKFTARSGKELQRPSLRPSGSERFFRFDRLGEDYSLDEISNRILENIRRKDPFPEETRNAVRRYRAYHQRVREEHSHVGQTEGENHGEQRPDGIGRHALPPVDHQLGMEVH